jgi:hypothetical protein
MDTRTEAIPAAAIKAVISQFRNCTIAKQRDGEHYRLDRSHATAYMTTHGKMEKKVYDFLRSLRNSKETIVYVDVCGRAKLGFADVNYSFSLQENQWEIDRTPERVVGDLFSAKDFYGFLRTIRSNGHRPSFVTCEPVAGLNDYTLWCNKKLGMEGYEEVLHQRLENNLRAMITLLRPGGFIYLTRVLQGQSMREFFAGVPQEKYKESLFLKSVCKTMRCSVDIEPTVCGPAFLVRKWLR